MNASQELLRQIQETSVPDKDRILRTRRLVDDLSRRIEDRALAQKLVRELNSEYLNLQLATLADDSSVTARHRKACLAVARRIGIACAETGTVGREPPAVHPVPA